MHEGSVLTVAEDLTREAQKIWNALRVVVDKEIDTRTASCVRSRKMTVMSAPNGSTIGVAEPFGQTVNIPYSSALANVKVGDTVWVDWKFDNASTMVAMATGDGQIVPDYFDYNDANRNLLEARKFIQTSLSNQGDLVDPTADTVPMDYIGVGASNYYIHVQPSTNYRLTLYDTREEADSVSCIVAQYNSNGTFISLAASGIGWRDPQGLTFVTNVNAAFLRLSLVGFPKYRWKLEKGDISTDWQPSPEDISPYTFDTTPTNNSKNPVTSGGIYTALNNKQDTLTFDSTPTQGSTNPVTSGGVYTADAGKVSKSGDTMTGTLLAPTMKVYDASYPMFVLQSSESDTSALGAVYENIANRQLVLRQRSTQGYIEDYYLPVNSATSANASYPIITSKEMIPWKTTTSWSTAIANANMDIKMIFDYSPSTLTWCFPIDIPVCAIGSSYKFFFYSFYDGSSNTSYYAQVYARTASTDYIAIYKNGTAESSSKYSYYFAYR